VFRTKHVLVALAGSIMLLGGGVIMDRSGSTDSFLKTKLRLLLITEAQAGLIDWENGSRVTFPVGLKFGKTFKGKTPISVNFQPYYTFQEDHDDVFGVRFSVNFIKPTWMHH